MVTFLYRLVLLLLYALSHQGVIGSPIASGHARSVADISRRHRVGDRPITFLPVHPSSLYGYEDRDEARHGVGDFVMHGLGGLMNIVTKEYGLRKSESFFWGPGVLEPLLYHRYQTNTR